MEHDKNLRFRSVTVRNFLSFGNQEQAVSLDDDLLTVVLGENMDTGGEDSRNGAGKSAIIDAICYALFGKTLREISNQKLINDLAGRGQPMSVRVEFDKGKWHYLVERGEKPSKLLFLRKPLNSQDDFYTREDRKLKYDISLARKDDTTNEICNLLGYNFTLFSYLVANSSESTSFLKLREEERRKVTESLLGFTILSERAKRLADIRKERKKDLIREETAYNTDLAANKRIEEQIQEIEGRSKVWETQRKRTIQELEQAITTLKAVDINAEIEALNMIAKLQEDLKEIGGKLSELQHQYTNLERDKKDAENGIKECQANITSAKDKMKALDKSECPTCGQHWEADPEYRGHLDDIITTEPERITDYQASIEKLDYELEKVEADYVEFENIKELEEGKLKEYETIELSFDTPEDAAEANATLKSLEEQLTSANVEINPHTESIENLRKKGLKKIEDTEVKRLKKLITHFNFLIDMFTNKDSFIRQQLIDEWLPYLNGRIAYYLDILELHHKVEFQPDLNINISIYGKEKDWGNLSKGERMRLNIALNFSFQDTFEFMNYRINFLCIDELIDTGICSRGAERTVDLLKDMTYRNHKRVLLITHRDDIASRVDDVMIVRKENDLSKIVKGE